MIKGDKIKLVAKMMTALSLSSLAADYIWAVCLMMNFRSILS